MASSDKLTQAARVRQACVSAGFFYIVSHGIDPNFLAEVFAQSKKFFTLPPEEKMVFRDKNQRGHIPFGYERLNPDFQTIGETKESYSFGPTIPGVTCLSIDRINTLLQGQNPFERNLFKSVASLVALALNLDESFFEQQGIMDKAASIMRLLHYPAEESNIEEGVFGAGEHSDWGCMTLLITNDIPGLQLCSNKDAVPQVWEDVPPMNGAYIVNLGQLLERWSNGLFRATLHRVIGKGVERYSVSSYH